ncbi:MAG: hypothetical protein JSS61_05785 [Verrucomicrobia bacterium]|nr:hypothetical protein [Verrucomicrobiota bacterium]
MSTQIQALHQTLPNHTLFIEGVTSETVKRVCYVVGKIFQWAAAAALGGAITATAFAGSVAVIYLVTAVALAALGTCGVYYATGSITGDDASFIPGQSSGIKNAGMNCWLNASLQLLVHVPNLMEKAKQIGPLSELTQRYETAQKNRKKVVENWDSQTIREMLSKATGIISPNKMHQEDAAQFFEYLSDNTGGMHTLYQRINEGESTLRREALIQIDLDWEPRPPFPQLFQEYFKYRTDIGQNIDLRFKTAPEDLLVQLKRFTIAPRPNTNIWESSKISESISGVSAVALPSSCVEDGQVANYICDGFLCHIGATPNGGHYVAYIKRGERWWYISDDHVSEVQPSVALEKMSSAYILHYKKMA